MAGNDTGADSSKKAKALSLSVTPEVRDAYGRQRQAVVMCNIIISNMTA